MPPSSKPNVPICGASLSASADCGVGIICSLDCPAHAARMEVDRISVIIFVTAGLDRKHIILKCLKRGKQKVNLLICSTRAAITDEQSRDAVSLKKDMRMNSQEKYSLVARWLHWIIAVLVIAGLALGLLHERLENVLPSAIPTHKSFCFTILALTLVLIGWRWGYKPPPPTAEMSAWENFITRVTHMPL